MYNDTELFITFRTMIKSVSILFIHLCPIYFFYVFSLQFANFTEFAKIAKDRQLNDFSVVCDFSLQLADFTKLANNI